MIARAGIVETFWSIQGEGYNAGRPAYFIRFSGCNLNCVFADGAICDTPWQHAVEKLTVEEIVCQGVAYVQDRWSQIQWKDLPSGDGWRDDAPMAVITGGEPTMQPCLEDLVEALNDVGFYTAIETNGTSWRPALEWLDWITVSPKDEIDQGECLGSSKLDLDVVTLMRKRLRVHLLGGEYRYVITDTTTSAPSWLPADRHYVSPAIMADGKGQEYKTGFPGFVPGTVERCQQIVQYDPRWRISLQVHKFMGVR